ncbi:MAG: hypothetical protein ACR2LR_13830 [Hassallia sp.]
MRTTIAFLLVYVKGNAIAFIMPLLKTYLLPKKLINQLYLIQQMFSQLAGREANQHTFS